jgi:hypothetical protein
LICAWLKLASRGVDGLDMQRFVTGVLVALAMAVSAGGVAVNVRADSAPDAAVPAPVPDQCGVPQRPVHVNAKAAEAAAKDYVVPLNSQGYNYNSYDDQWRPEIPAAPAPAAPEKP